jgi:uncharacterized repeat protein (TIGR02543 family)
MNQSSVEEVYYSDNYFRDPMTLGEAGNYSAGFEGVSKGSYASGDADVNGIIWTLDDALVGSDTNKVGANSVRSRGSIYTLSGFSGISTITFKAAIYGSDDPNSIILSLSNDGNTWVDVSDGLNETSITSSTLVDYSFNILDSTNFSNSDLSSSELLRVRLTVGLLGERINIDEVIVSYSAYNGPIHEITYINESVTTFEMLAQGDTVSFVPTKSNYTFVGWYINEGLTIEYNDTPVNQSYVLYAKFTPDIKTITFNYNGADGGEMPATIDAPYESYVDLPVPTKTGYDFDGWFNEGLTTEYSDPYQVPSVNRNMYAKWIINDLGKAMADAAALTQPSTIDQATSLTLSATGTQYESTITWSSSHPDIISATTGEVVLPEETTEVTLTATVTYNGTPHDREFAITVYPDDAPQTNTLTLSTLTASGTYPTSYGTASWLINSITFSGIGLTRNGSGVEYTIQGNSSQSSKITSTVMGIIQSISIRIPNTGSVAASSAKFYVELADNSSFTGSVKYGFGNGYSSTTNIDLSQHSSAVTVANVLTVKDTSTDTPSIIINTVSHNSTYVRFVWENGASYIAQIDISYLNP